MFVYICVYTFNSGSLRAEQKVLMPHAKTVSLVWAAAVENSEMSDAQVGRHRAEEKTGRRWQIQT